MPWMPGVPADPAPTFGALAPIAIVLHRTYGGWGGDYAVGKRGTFQFLIGQDDGQWVQFASTDSVCYHCNGANLKAFGIELTGTNDDPLTDWQAARLGDVLRWGHAEHGIPLDYTDPLTIPPASIHVNDGTFRGVLSHASVMTDDNSSQHSDMVTVADYNRAIVPAQQEDDTLYLNCTSGQQTADCAQGYIYAVMPYRVSGQPAASAPPGVLAVAFPASTTDCQIEVDFARDARAALGAHGGDPGTQVSVGMIAAGVTAGIKAL